MTPEEVYNLCRVKKDGPSYNRELQKIKGLQKFLNFSISNEVVIEDENVVDVAWLCVKNTQSYSYIFVTKSGQKFSNFLVCDHDKIAYRIRMEFEDLDEAYTYLCLI